MAQALLPPVTDADQAKFNQRLVDKLKYCKEVLMSIRNASANQAALDENAGMGEGLVSTKTSKASLR